MGSRFDPKPNNRFVVPEDRPKLMRAICGIIYEKSSRLQLDCVIRVRP